MAVRRHDGAGSDAEENPAVRPALPQDNRRLHSLCAQTGPVGYGGGFTAHGTIGVGQRFQLKPPYLRNYAILDIRYTETCRSAYFLF